jgi:hypothetical protein
MRKKTVNVALSAIGNIVPQFGPGQKPASVSGLSHDETETAACFREETDCHGDGIGIVRLKVASIQAVAQRPGSQNVLEGRLFKSSAANDQQV